MSRAGLWFVLHVSPRIDKVIIPRTNGRLSSIGVDAVGLLTTTSCPHREIRIFRLRPVAG